MTSPAPGHRFEAIVFDLDGVLIDSETVIHDVWTRCFATYGASFSLEEWVTRVGSHAPGRFDPYEALFSRATIPLPELEELRSSLRAEQIHLIDAAGPLPGVRDWIATARRLGLGLGVATSSSRAWLEERLAANGLRTSFDVTVTPDDGHPEKPDPSLYLDACRQLGVATDHSVAIEDSPTGVLAARRADMYVIAVPGTVTEWMDLSSAHHRMDSLLELDCEAALERLEKVVTNAHE